MFIICSFFCNVHHFSHKLYATSKRLHTHNRRCSAHRRRSKHQSTLEYRYIKKNETGNRETDNLDDRRDEERKDQSRKREETKRDGKGSETKSMCEKGGEREAVREKMRKGRGRPETLKEQ